MAGKKSAPLNLTQRQRALLEQHCRKRNTGHHEQKRIQIILRGSLGESTYSISREINLGIDAVRSWRKRWSLGYSSLLVYESGKDGDGVSDYALLNKMLELLKDAPRPGTPCRITKSEKQQIVAMACRKPSEYGIPRTRWTNELLASTAESEGVVKSISPRYVCDILKKGGLTSAQKPLLAVSEDS